MAEGVIIAFDVLEGLRNILKIAVRLVSELSLQYTEHYTASCKVLCEIGELQSCFDKAVDFVEFVLSVSINIGGSQTAQPIHKIRFAAIMLNQLWKHYKRFDYSVAMSSCHSRSVIA